MRGGYRRGTFVATRGLASLEATADVLTLRCLGRKMLVIGRDADVSLKTDGKGTIAFEGAELPWGSMTFGVGCRRLERLIHGLRSLGWSVG